jgi:hypothetical protein
MWVYFLLKLDLFSSFIINALYNVQVACKETPSSSRAQKIVDVLHETALLSSGFFVSYPHFRTSCRFYLCLLSIAISDVNFVFCDCWLSLKTLASMGERCLRCWD